MPVKRRGRISDNVGRNARAYALWKDGKTIREAALLSGIPEGTLAYYWRKFNQAAAAGKPIIVGSDEHKETVNNIGSETRTNLSGGQEIRQKKLGFIDGLIAVGMISKPLGPENTSPTKKELLRSYNSKEVIRMKVNKFIDSEVSRQNLDSGQRERLVVELYWEIQERGWVITSTEAAAVSEELTAYGKKLIAANEANKDSISNLQLESNGGRHSNDNSKKMTPQEEDIEARKFLLNVPWQKDKAGFGDIFPPEQVPGHVINFMKRNGKPSVGGYSYKTNGHLFVLSNWGYLNRYDASKENVELLA